MITYAHTYHGFMNQVCHCVIRILDEKDKPLTVICAQDPLPHETSITNMAEHLHSDVCQKFRDASPLNTTYEEFKNSALSKKIENIDTLTKKGWRRAILRLAQKAAEWRESRTETEQRLKDMVWIEYSPPLLGTTTPCIMHVTFDDGQPCWQPTTFETLSRLTRYTVEQLRIPQLELDIARAASMKMPSAQD